MYINSTNSNLQLNQGELSRLLLKACGKELQEEASRCAPLQHGRVATTKAYELHKKCKQIYHIFLPDYKAANSEKVRVIL